MEEKERMDPSSLKFTAIKVDVSSLTSRVHHKAFVISSQTTSRDLREMVLRKLGLDVATVAPSTCLVGESQQKTRGRHRHESVKILDEADLLMGLYGGHSRRTITLKLVPRDQLSPQGHRQLPVCNGAGDSPGEACGVPEEAQRCSAAPAPAPALAPALALHAPRNGMTLPGFHDHCAVALQKNSPPWAPAADETSSPRRVEYKETAANEFIIHYEPHDSLEARRPGEEYRGAEEKTNRPNNKCYHNRSLDSVMTNFSPNSEAKTNAASSLIPRDSERVEREANQDPHSESVAKAERSFPSGIRGRSSVGTVEDGDHRKEKPSFTRHASESNIEQGLFATLKDSYGVPSAFRAYRSQLVAGQSASVDGAAVIDWYRPVERTTRVTRRTLPAVNVSREALEWKKRSVTDLFAEKLKAFISKKKKPYKPIKYARPVCHSTPRIGGSGGGGEGVKVSGSDVDDDVMSVTSLEVADIMSGAEAMKPLDENEVDTIPDDDDEYGFSSSVFNNTSNTSGSSPRKSIASFGGGHTKASLSDFVEQSMQSFLTTQPGATGAGGDQNDNHIVQQEIPPPLNDKLSVFALLNTHSLAQVVLCRKDVTRSMGVRLCDVSYVKCARHVLSQRKQQGISGSSGDTASGQRGMTYSVPEAAKRWKVVAVGGLDKDSTTVASGRLFRSDIVIEVNGQNTLHVTAKDASRLLSPERAVCLVVGRPRFQNERGTSP